MKIVADENIPFVKEAFGTLGSVTLVAGRAMNEETVAGADVLLVRSVTLVDERLLAASGVRFVGSATIGTDHVDIDYLEGLGIGFAAAPGSNATSVAEYITAALLVLAERGSYRLREKSIGIVGVGNVGSRVEARARALGMKVVLNDPPLARETGDEKYRSTDEILDCDIVTIHVPLSGEGPDATFHMVNEDFVARMKTAAVLINTSRGKVAETRALMRALDGDQLGEVVLDVFENEPDPKAAVIGRAAIATPHIAGYGFDGKVRGTQMLYDAVCEFFGADAVWHMEHVMPDPPSPLLEIDAAGRDDEEVIREAVLAVCDIEGDDRHMREILKVARPGRPAFFDRLRKTYPVRREFHNTRIVLANGTESLKRMLGALGFQVA